jgi:hypothetical protein
MVVTQPAEDLPLSLRDLPPNLRDLLPEAEEVEIPEEIAALRAELMEERRRYGGVLPYTPERMAKARKAFFYPPLTEEEIASYDAAMERRRDCCH